MCCFTDSEGGWANPRDDVSGFPLFVEFGVWLNTATHIAQKDGVAWLIHGKADVIVGAVPALHGVLLLEAVGIGDAPGGKLALEMFRKEILGVAVAW